MYIHVVFNSLCFFTRLWWQQSEERDFFFHPFPNSSPFICFPTHLMPGVHGIQRKQFPWWSFPSLNARWCQATVFLFLKYINVLYCFHGKYIKDWIFSREIHFYQEKRKVKSIVRIHSYKYIFISGTQTLRPAHSQNARGRQLLILSNTHIFCFSNIKKWAQSNLQNKNKTM